MNFSLSASASASAGTLPLLGSASRLIMKLYRSNNFMRTATTHVGKSDSLYRHSQIGKFYFLYFFCKFVDVCHDKTTSCLPFFLFNFFFLLFYSIVFLFFLSSFYLFYFLSFLLAKKLRHLHKISRCEIFANFFFISKFFFFGHLSLGFFKFLLFYDFLATHTCLWGLRLMPTVGLSRKPKVYGH